jgi:23S rRNA (guanosine2251-2'-O)-methyltransferase
MDQQLVYGKNAVRSALESKHGSVLFVSRHLQDDPIVLLARKNGIPVQVTEDARLTSMAGSSAHQGFVVAVKGYGTFTLQQLIGDAQKSKYPLLLMLDGLEDPHNLGAILRSADAFGADGIIIKNHSEVQLTGTVAKVSTGAIDYVKVAVVANLSQSIETLKKAGYWVVASDGSATQSYRDVDYKCPIVLVVGSEGFGIAPLVLSHSDFIVKIPMVGHVNSLNASVACGILLSYIHASRQ